MTIKALNPFDPVWYIPPSEKDEQNPTTFQLKGLDGEAMGYIGPEFLLDEHGRVRNLTGRGIDLALNYGLVGWKNFNNDKGAVKFNRANFKLIPYDVRAQLATEIVILSSPDEDERKN